MRFRVVNHVEQLRRPAARYARHVRHVRVGRGNVRANLSTLGMTDYKQLPLIDAR